MKKILFAAIFPLLLSMVSVAQTDDKKEALSVINQLFIEMSNHNPTAIAGFFTKEGILTAILKGKDGKSRMINMTGEKFSQNFAEKRGEIKEDMYAPKVEVDGDWAMVWGRYVFFIDGKVSHCGVNAFHLIRIDSSWKIGNSSSTIDPTACSAEEKARKP